MLALVAAVYLVPNGVRFLSIRILAVAGLIWRRVQHAVQGGRGGVRCKSPTLGQPVAKAGAAYRVRNLGRQIAAVLLVLTLSAFVRAMIWLVV